MDITQLLKTAAKIKASDLHLIKGEPPIVRIDGALLDLNDFLTAPEDTPAAYVMSADGEIASENKETQESKIIVSEEDLEIAINQILSPEQKKRFLEEKDLDFALSFDGFRLRINLARERGNIKLTARIISNHKVSLEEINMPQVVQRLLHLRQGLILLTGPAGSGKSTSLAAMIGYINENLNSNIVTLEDPIEYMFSPEASIITQRELGIDMDSFAAGLKHVLRQDPNVVMIGEMRDLETVSAAVTLAETGHLVLATLHTSSAAQTIDRIIDMFPTHQQNQIKSQLSTILAAVISQRLLPRLGGGRIATREVMIMNSAVANLIREHKTVQLKSVIETSLGEGMISFSRDLKDLYGRNLITQEVYEEYLSSLSNI